MELLTFFDDAREKWHLPDLLSRWIYIFTHDRSDFFTNAVDSMRVSHK
jgi:hypothetical protein